MFNNLKPNVLIVSSPRTGSTALLRDIGSALQCQSWNEPANSPDKWEQFISSRDHSHVIKFHADDQHKYDSIDFRSYTIVSIHRRNKVEQVASNYISMMRNRWGYDTLTVSEQRKFTDEHIQIDDNEIRENIWAIEGFERSLERFIEQWGSNHRYYYEDCSFGSRVVKTPLPSNYGELIAVIENVLTELNATK